MNFNELYKKIKSLDEAIEPKDELQGGAGASDECAMSGSSNTPLMGEEPVEECGGDMPGDMMHPPKQSDSVTMNVSMNGSGAGGIKDLMQILRNIESGSNGDDSADKLLGSDKDIAFGEEQATGGFDQASTSPSTVTLDIDSVTQTGNDLASHGGNEVEKVNGGGNPYTNVGEGLQRRLYDLYTAIKEGYNPNSASAEHRRNLDKSEHDRLKAAAEKDGASDADKARYKRYQDRKAATAAAYEREMER